MKTETTIKLKSGSEIIGTPETVKGYKAEDILEVRHNSIYSDKEMIAFELEKARDIINMALKKLRK